MPGVIQYAAAKRNQLDVHHGNMNSALNFSPEGKGKNRGDREHSHLCSLKIYVHRKTTDILQEYT